MSAIPISELAPQERYVYKPFEGSSHSWAFEKLDELRPDSEVLDIGPGSGIFGIKLRERGVKRVYGVEIDEAARRHVSPFYEEVTEDLEAFRGRQFDCILLLDVLEHMTDPFEFIRQIPAFLRPGGTLLISLPNIAHWSVRFGLLFGRFDYQERGILDKTHFNHFTRKRFKELLAASALRTEELSASIEPFEFVLPRLICENPLYEALRGPRKALAKNLPGMFAYQHLAAMRKIKEE